MNKNTRIVLIILGVFILTLGILSLKEDEKRFEVSKGLNIFATLFRDVNLFYVDEIEPEKLVQTGIDAMLKSLDPYTVYYPESKMDEFKMMTTGAYAGIGSIISMKNDYVVIREPYRNSPADRAGLLPGDLILAIDGMDMKGKNTEFVSQHLKGQPGKEVTIKIKRLGVEKPMELKVVRENVQLPSVPYYGMFNDKIGYIYFTSFTDKSAEDVRRAIMDLKQKGAESLVLDLRGNGGGLLDQAVEIANYFLPRNTLVVNTKGKIKQWDKEYFTSNNPIVPDMKLAVLIDRSSASASEILSGSLQDYDRAVIVGERSFGKGLVQTTRDLVYNTKLKVTTAKYYIPSGRCIQAVDYAHRNPDGSVGTIPDSLITAFKTKAGRTVYDGGGITPDIKIEPEKYAKITQELVIKDMIFDFVNEYALTHPSIPAPATFELTDDIYNDFKKYLKEHQFEYETASQAVLEKLAETAKAEKYYDQVKGQIDRLKLELGHSVDRDLDLFRKEISEILSDQLMSRYYMQEGVVEFRMRHDSDVAKAVDVLSDEEVYRKILK
ncbi:S41 family peptidase [uncultured Sanguibacteroides sp.]|uniref:S41 family peptidase n=1 Tax=uncultured Sanguibacteroides sp. TaxID=1635151 RepID=UPI0025FA6CDE|nr:S41 family peptidase [uncultured Sanguibacteroides sp.]